MPYPPYLDFEIKPYGLAVGATYVLTWTRASNVLCDDGHVIRNERRPAWWITIVAVRRHRKGFWRATFAINDLRDPTVWLRAGSGYTTSRRGAVDPLPVVVDESVREKAREEFWHARRLARFAEEQRARSRARRQRRAA